ncbi:MAG: DUF2357 domain-containing protein [Clostridium sp.]|uniref:DUF2357 domain-containing protein n=1 Tax=Clostridium sp. TaxID=1506 RepID=UPI003D6D371F
MEQLSSGDEFKTLGTSDNYEVEIFDEKEKCWVSIGEAYFEEAKIYSWRINSEKLKYITMQGIPQMMRKSCGNVHNVNGFFGEIQTPFACGIIVFDIDVGGNTQRVKSFVYPDSRKITLKQYENMVYEILEEANVCLKYSGLAMAMDTEGFQRKVSFAQWNYIQRSMKKLKRIFSKIESAPLKVLIKNELITDVERVKKIGVKTEKWIEKNGPRFGGTQEKLPNYIKVISSYETYNIYENRVVKFQLMELQVILRKYCKVEYEEMKLKARQYLDLVNYWLSNSYLAKVQPYKGKVVISQVFRKHPVYRLWYNWFRELYNHKKWKVGLSTHFPLKDTFHLYEIWAFMQVIKVCRELDILEDTSEIYLKNADGILLELKEHNQSKVKLKNGGFIYYQKCFQRNSKPYYTYTQRMIPDIVLEFNGELIVLDPKYRVDANLGNALAEMHKYRDGILRKEDDCRVVLETYILAPLKGERSEKLFDLEYHKRYNMGAFVFKPGCQIEEFKDFLSKKILLLASKTCLPTLPNFTARQYHPLQ